MANIKLRKGDKVIVLSGKDKGKTGIIEQVSTKTREVIVSNVNMVKKHVKATQQKPAGGIVEVVKPLPVSKVQLVCPSCGKAARIGYTKGAKSKERICKRCNKAIHVQKSEAGEK